MDEIKVAEEATGVNPDTLSTASANKQVRAPLTLDIFEANLNTGLPYEKIANELGPEDQLTPLKDPDAYFEKHKDKFINRKDFSERYTQALNVYDHINNQKFQTSLYPVGSEKLGYGLDWDPTWGQKNITSINTNADVYSFYGTPNPLHLETPSQNAGRKGLVYQPGEVWDGEKFVLKEGAIVQERKLDFLDRMLGNYYVVPEKDSQGEPITDSWGRQQFHYERIPDIVGGKHGPYYNLEKASIWGDQKLYGRGLLAPLLSFGSTATVGVGQALASMGSIATDAYGNTMYGEELWDLKEKNEIGAAAIMNRVFDTMIETAEGWKYRPSESAATAKWFGDGMFGFMYQTGTGLGYLVPQRVGMSALQGAGVTSKGALRAFGTGIGTSQAVAGFYESARKAGLGAREASYLALAALPAVAVTEYMFNSKWMSAGLGVNQKKAVTDRISKSITAVAEAGINPSTEASEPDH